MSKRTLTLKGIEANRQRAYIVVEENPGGAAGEGVDVEQALRSIRERDHVVRIFEAADKERAFDFAVSQASCDNSYGIVDNEGALRAAAIYVEYFDGASYRDRVPVS